KGPLNGATPVSSVMCVLDNRAAQQEGHHQVQLIRFVRVMVENPFRSSVLLHRNKAGLRSTIRESPTVTSAGSSGDAPPRATRRGYRQCAGNARRCRA